MTEQDSKDKYIKCSRCKCKYINDDNHNKTDFGYDRLNERYKTCVTCRERHKQYVSNNTEKIKDLKHAYWINHKDETHNKRKELKKLAEETEQSYKDDLEDQQRVVKDQLQSQLKAKQDMKQTQDFTNQALKHTKEERERSEELINRPLPVHLQTTEEGCRPASPVQGHAQQPGNAVRGGGRPAAQTAPTEGAPSWFPAVGFRASLVAPLRTA